MPQKIKEITKLPLTNDYIFKKIFAKKGNESILKDFLIGILDIPIEKVEVQAEVSLQKQLKENKLGRLDIVAILDDNAVVNIEVQVLNLHDFIERSLYYWSGNYYNHLREGEKYQNVKKTISINILNYELFEEGPFHEIVKLKRDYQNKILTEKIEMHFLQIPKFTKEKRGVETKLEQWMQFISQTNQREVELAMEENKEIQKANEEYEYLTGDEEERRLAFLRDKAIRDEASLKETGRIEGRKEGRIEGIKEGERRKQEEIARILLAKNNPIEEIAEITKLTKEEIEKL